MNVEMSPKLNAVRSYRRAQQNLVQLVDGIPYSGPHFLPSNLSPLCPIAVAQYVFLYCASLALTLRKKLAQRSCTRRI